MDISEGISLKELLSGGTEFEINLHNMPKDDSEDIYDSERNEDMQAAMANFQNMSCLDGGVPDDDDYVEGEPFELIALRMTNLLEDGSIKKRIIRDGYGVTPPEKAIVKVDYNAYVEYEPEPFDSTYARKKRHEFVLHNGEVLLGLDLAVQSMKVNEKAQFLVKPTYAYGALGCLGRVPKNSIILFEVELHEVVDSGAALSYNKLSEEHKKEFSEVYKYCLALCVRAKEKFNRNIKDSVKEYNIAITRMETVEMTDYSQQMKQQDLLLRLYTNLLVCYVRLEEYRKGCTAANKIYELTKGTTTKIHAKVFYSNAKCLRMLGDYTHAKKKLTEAHRNEPKNPDIAQEFILLEQAIQKHKLKEKEMAKGFMGQL